MKDSTGSLADIYSYLLTLHYITLQLPPKTEAPCNESPIHPPNPDLQATPKISLNSFLNHSTRSRSYRATRMGDVAKSRRGTSERSPDRIPLSISPSILVESVRQIDPFSFFITVRSLFCSFAPSRETVYTVPRPVCLPRWESFGNPDLFIPR